MPEFRTAKLIDLPIQFIDGDRSYRYPKKEEFQNDGIPFLNSAAIVDNKIDYSEINFISHEKFTQLSKGKLQPQDIVMTTRGNGIGKVALFNNSKYSTGFINAQMLIVRADSKNFDQGFLFYLLSSANFYEKIWNYASGAAQPQIPIRDLREIEINYPDLPVQRKIADVLSAYDDLIEVNARRIRVLEAMAQSVYREWFGNVDAKSLPRGWEIVKVGELINFAKGKKPKTTSPTGKIPLLLIESFRSGATEFIDDPTTVIAETDDIIMVMDGASSGSIYTGYYGAVGSTLGRYRPIDRQRFSHYQLYFFILENFKQIADNNIGSAIPHANKDFINQLDIVLPTQKIENQFHEQMIPMFDLISVLKKKNANLRRTRDLLLPRLVSGEVVIE